MEIIILSPEDIEEVKKLDAEKVKKEIKKRGLKLTWVAEQANITSAQLSYILNDRYRNKKNKAKLVLALKKLNIPFF